MNTNNPNNTAPRKRKIIQKFFKTFAATLGFFLAAFVLVVAGLSFFNDKDGEEGSGKTGGGFGRFVTNIFTSPSQDKVYALLLGTDYDASRTDTMILVCFDPETEEVSMVSLPRDTMVTIPQERLSHLQDIGSPISSDGVVKLTEVHHFAYVVDKEIAVDYLRQQIKELLDVEVDFYVKIDLDAFDYLVDEIGGVEFDVPVRMYYWDPTQSLLIDLQPGVQLLDGENAQGLVRYRGYAGGDDFMRMQVQQDFIKAFAKQALAKDSIVQNAPAMINAALKYVETDFDMAELPTYLKYLGSFSTDNIHTYSLPVLRTEKVKGKDFVILDEEGSRELIQEVFYEDKKEVVEEDSKDKKIQVLNGGGIAGLAKAGQARLEENGFTVTDIGDYTGTKESHTRIFVAKRGYGNDLKALFSGSAVVYDPSMDDKYDIIVVIGKDGIE